MSSADTGSGAAVARITCDGVAIPTADNSSSFSPVFNVSVLGTNSK
jgi:hypothetical protein